MTKTETRLEAAAERAAVTLEYVDGILIATVENPPVNALSHGVRSGLDVAIARLEVDPQAQALIILCAGKTFIAGADIREFGRPVQEPRLGQVIDRMDKSQKPVIAALHGNALGGGLEVALAASYRIAAPGTKLGLPEVTLGLLPGSGGTVRLPRLIGVGPALEMIISGRPVSAEAALESGLIDALAPGDLRQAALDFAAQLLAKGQGLRRTSDLPIPDFDPELFTQKRAEQAKRAKGFNAPQIAVDLVEMVTQTPAPEAIAREYAICKELIATPQSQALRGLFAAERAAAKGWGIPEGTPERPVRSVAIVGPGTMGRGIAQVFLDIGLPVTLIGLNDETLAKARSAIEKSYASLIKRGSLTAEASEARLGQMTLATSYDGLGATDLAIEAVTEDLGVKEQVLAQLNAALPPGAIIATNTSFLDIEALADASGRPADFVGMHFFNPANIMKLLENVAGSRTAPDVLATVMALGKRLGKTAVLVGRSEGFVANRMLSKRSREAQFLLEDGASPEQVDRVLAGFGFPIGPFALADLAGMDVMAAARAARKARMTQREQDCDIVDRLAAMGRLGQKTGAGYYLYGEDRKPRPDPEIAAFLSDYRAERGRTSRAIEDREILERCLLAMVNEAAKLLGEGAAARASDIDVIWTAGFGWPRHLGGPMFWADQMGLPEVKARLDHYADLVGDEYFRPAPLIEELAASGGRFLTA